MGWTSPATWIAGVSPTAAWLNQQIRDNFKAIGDPWTSFVPTWTTSGTNPAIGNGSITGAYMEAGKTVMFWARITMGSTTTYGSAAWVLGRPVAPTTATAWVWNGRATDSSTGSAYPVQMFSSGLITTDATTAGGAWRSVTATVPFTWAVGDTLDISGFYEAA